MARKRVKRLDIKEDYRDRLDHQKIHFIKDILDKNRYELMRAIEVSLFTADNILHKASKACAPKHHTCLELWERNHGRRFLPTSMPPLDHILHGGLPNGTVTEIAGPSGCGKTQFCTMLTLLAARNLDGAVLYIDTESAFSAERLVEMAVNKFPEEFGNEENLRSLSELVHVYLESTCDTLLKRLENLEEHIIEKKARLIIVDSIASLIRKEFDSRTGRNMVERANVLVRQAAILKHVAETFNIPVVVTNQITTRYGPSTKQVSESRDSSAHQSENDVSLEGESGYVTAALGNTWSHCVNTRLIVQYLDAHTRQILVAKSQVAPFAKFSYTIQSTGLVVEEHGADHYDGTDPGLQKIRVRTSIEQDAFRY